MRYIIRALSKRQECIDYLKHYLPEADYLIDTPGNAMQGFLQALQTAGNDPAVHMEEDIWLTKGFQDKVETAIAERPNEVINFFSMRKADLTKGSRHEAGGNFSMNLCFYLPAGMSSALYHYAQEWPRIEEHPTGYDYLMQDWFRLCRMKYFLFVPSLVDHRQIRSEIDPRRSSKRQSLTFKDGIYI